MAGGFGGADCRRHLGRYSRRSLSRTTRMLCAAQPARPRPVGAKVFLPVYVRVLLQPLRHHSLPADHTIQTALSRLAWLLGCGLCAGVDCQLVHEPVWAATPRHPKRAGRNRRKRTRDGRAGAARSLTNVSAWQEPFLRTPSRQRLPHWAKNACAQYRVLHLLSRDGQRAAGGTCSIHCAGARSPLPVS
jgi:hypothetical protein